MTVTATALTFFLDIGNFAARRDFPVSANDAPTSECGEAEQTNQTHTPSDNTEEQVTCRRSRRVHFDFAIHIGKRAREGQTAARLF